MVDVNPDSLILFYKGKSRRGNQARKKQHERYKQIPIGFSGALWTNQAKLLFFFRNHHTFGQKRNTVFCKIYFGGFACVEFELVFLL